MTDDKFYPGYGEAEWRDRFASNEIEWVEPDQLLANPDNQRVHTKLQQEQVEKLIDELGWVQTVYVNRNTGRVVDGHLRITLAIRKEEKVPVVWLDLTEDEERIALTFLDRTAAKAGIDLSILETNLDFAMDFGFEEMSLDFAEDEGMGAAPDEWQEFDEDVVDEVEMTECPSCGHVFPK